jgi:hypothetical protein
LLTDEQKIAFNLAGTVRLPSPAPASGTIVLWAASSTVADASELWLKIIHEIHLKLKVIRTVRLADVRAIIAPRAAWEAKADDPIEPEAEPSSGERQVKLQERFGDLALGQIRAYPGPEAGDPVVVRWLTRAVAYVDEAARVLTQVEAGHTAAESAEYRAYIVGADRERLLCESQDPNFC